MNAIARTMSQRSLRKMTNHANLPAPEPALPQGAGSPLYPDCSLIAPAGGNPKCIGCYGELVVQVSRRREVGMTLPGLKSPAIYIAGATSARVLARALVDRIASDGMPGRAWFSAIWGSPYRFSFSQSTGKSRRPQPRDAAGGAMGVGRLRRPTREKDPTAALLSLKPKLSRSSLSCQTGESHEPHRSA